MAKKHGGKPTGMRYADVLARKRQIAAAINAAAKDNSVRIQADVRCQRQLWLCVIALNERFGFGAERVTQFLHACNDIMDEWDQMADSVGPDYANEKLRQRAEQVTGMHIEHIYERQMQEAAELAKKDGIHLDPMEI